MPGKDEGQLTGPAGTALATEKFGTDNIESQSLNPVSLIRFLIVRR